MEISGSEGSSGCESGWTDYLDESSETPDQYQTSVDDDDDDDGARSFRASAYEDEEEDLSMVSDASSGPPHLRYYDDDDDYEVDYFGKDGFSCSVTKVKSKAEETKHQHSYLDDTANSPAFSCTKSCVDSSNNQASKIKQGSNQFGFWHPKKAGLS